MFAPATVIAWVTGMSKDIAFWLRSSSCSVFLLATNPDLETSSLSVSSLRLGTFRKLENLDCISDCIVLPTSVALEESEDNSDLGLFLGTIMGIIFVLLMAWRFVVILDFDELLFTVVAAGPEGAVAVGLGTALVPVFWGVLRMAVLALFWKKKEDYNAFTHVHHCI